MATNLVAEISNALAPAIVSRIASGLGLGDASTQKAINAAVPALLAGLISLVSKSQGATKLDEVLTKQEPGLLSSLVGAIGGSGQQAVIDKGSNTLTSLLGGKTVATLADTLGQYAGIGNAGSKGLLGLLGTGVLGILGQERREKGLDASGLAKLLTSQKETVAAALPSGFSKYLGDTGILDDVTRSTTKAAYNAPPAAAPSIWRWVLGALALLALGVLAWRLVSTPKHEAAAPPAQSETSYADLLDKLRGVKVGDVDVGELATSAVNHLRSSVEGITDEATAQTALPQLTATESEFDQLNGLLSQLSPEARKTIADTFTAIRPGLNQLLDRALALPGVGAVIKPAVDAIRSKLDALAVAS